MRRVSVCAIALLPLFSATGQARQPHQVVDTIDVNDGTAFCMIVKTRSGALFSFPTTDNPLNMRTQGQFELDGATLEGAAMSYSLLNATNPAGVTTVFWDNGPPDPNCHLYLQILNLGVGQ